MVEPGFEFIFAAEGKLADPIQFGDTYEGARRMIPILDGQVDMKSLKILNSKNMKINFWIL